MIKVKGIYFFVQVSYDIVIKSEKRISLQHLHEYTFKKNNWSDSPKKFLCHMKCIFNLKYKRTEAFTPKQIRQ